VLSKLRHSNLTPDALLPQPEAADFRQLGDALGLKFDEINPVIGGTMGNCFIFKASGVPAFLKTHRQVDSKTLAKEGSVAAHAYGARIGVRMHAVGVRLWMVCNVLEQGLQLSPDQAWKLTQDYRIRLVDMPNADTIVPRGDDFGLLLAAADEGAQYLVAQQAITGQCVERVKAALDLLRKYEFDRCLCHGDLSPKNIMNQSGTPLAVDWEDTFWGVAGYDYLLWLTFFENRRYYGERVLGRTPWGHNLEIAILIMILTLKCVLSSRNNTHQGDSLTFNQRIMEVVTLK